MSIDLAVMGIGSDLDGSNFASDFGSDFGSNVGSVAALFQEGLNSVKENVGNMAESINSIQTDGESFDMTKALQIQMEFSLFSLQQDLYIKSATKAAQSVDQVAKSQ